MSFWPRTLGSRPNCFFWRYILISNEKNYWVLRGFEPTNLSQLDQLYYINLAVTARSGVRIPQIFLKIYFAEIKMYHHEDTFSSKELFSEMNAFKVISNWNVKIWFCSPCISNLTNKVGLRFRFFGTVWKFHDFPITQILREINFGQSRSSKTAVFAFFEGLKFC